MASEEAPSAAARADTSALQRLTALLTATAGAAPTPHELAELLWLAAQSDGVTAKEGAGPAGGAPPRDGDVPPQETVPVTAPTAAERTGPPARTAPAVPPADRVPLRLPAPEAATGPTAPAPAEPGAARRLLAPAPPMLPRPLALQRALRPLKRTVPAARARLLDERATADRIARLGAHPDVWLPVLRPAHDRWLRLSLVHDTGPTMPVWRPLVRELHTVLAQSGVFRTVTLHPATPDGRARQVPDTADGRTVTLVVSDCTGPQWRPGPAGERWFAALRHWATRMPLAVVQPLPEHLWSATALTAEPGLLSSPATAAPLSALAFTPYDPDAPAPPPSALPLPVLEPGAPWLANWAALVAGPGGARTPGAAAWLPPAPVPPEPAGATDPGPAPPSAQDLVLRFRATASPEAFRLAGHLALAVPSVPVMRLVQRAVNRDPRPQHLAEVILSGMLTTAAGPPGSYDFRPGVRDLLLRTLPRSTRGRTRELLAHIGGLIDEQAGLTAGEFRAEATTTAGPGAGEPGTAFATVREETVRRLAGHPQETTREPRGDDGVHGTVLRFETSADLAARPETRITLEVAVHEVLARGGLARRHYEIHVRDDGYAVRIRPGAYLLPVLAAALRWLPGPLADLPEPPLLRVTFQDGPDGTDDSDGAEGTDGTHEAEGPVPSPRSRALPRPRPLPRPEKAADASPVLLTVPPALYDAFARSSAASGPHRFRPLYGDAPDGPPLAWNCPLPPPRPEDEARDLVRGPLLTADLRQLGIPAPGRTAIVHTRPDGPLTLLNPADPYGGRPPGPATYYEVDLTPQHTVHRLSLPSSGKGDFAAAVELSWRVADPVAFVRAEADGVSERLRAHLLAEGARITRRHSVRRSAGARRAVASQLGRWPVPGLAVTCAVTLAPEHASLPETPRPAAAGRPLDALLAESDAVLFGFDGPLTRLFTATTARAAALDLLRVVTEHRDPEDAFAGRPAGDPGAVGRELFVHPLDVLRAFAHDPMGPLLRDRLDRLELDAVPDAPATHHSVVLVRTLHDAGRRVGVVTDVCEQAVHSRLDPYRLPLLAGVHGRGDALERLMPDPHCVQRALRQLDASAAGLMIGSTPAELAAARAAGLRFVGLARNPTVEQALLDAGCDVTVPSLTPVLEAARAL
ncbi:SAV_2336 N-terminal domain-related protein [Streptomyces sp. NPDC020597]|uniref:SAV_2336 N-terminal domain-related protein n=1 Tax=unclassified Streptomyces TaxID=2593676 RepID=UPI00378760EB